jgi:hypothetical protein
MPNKQATNARWLGSLEIGQCEADPLDLTVQGGNLVGAARPYTEIRQVELARPILSESPGSAKTIRATRRESDGWQDETASGIEIRLLLLGMRPPDAGAGEGSTPASGDACTQGPWLPT